MKHKRAPQLLSRGFALPTILIASVVMMIVLVSAVTAVSSSNSLLANQYYNQLAREAAESGLANVKVCMVYTNYNPTWTDANPLRPDTDCTGINSNGSDPNVLNTGNIRATFRVSGPQAGAAGTIRVVSTGIVQLVRNSNSSQVWRTFQVSVAQTSRYNDTPQIAGGAGWKSSGHNGYMLASNGTLYGWGDNSSSQLGDSTLGTTVSTPIKMALPSGVSRVKKVINSGQGASTVCIIATNDTLGDQAYCRGQGGDLASTTWQRFGLGAGLTATDMVVNGYGSDSGCVLASDGQVYCAGFNDRGLLGNGTTSTADVPVTAPMKFRLDLANPGPVSGSASSLTVKKIFNQDLFSCVIASDDQAYCAGRNGSGQLGRGSTATNVFDGNSVPGRVLVPGNPVISDIRTTYHGGIQALYFQTSSGDIYMSGDNTQGTANDSAYSGTVYSTPRKMTNGAFGKMISVGEAGNNYNALCVIGSGTFTDSGLWCMGANNFGETGFSGTGNCSPTPTPWTMRCAWGPSAVPVVNTSGVTQAVTYNLNKEANLQMNSVMVMTTTGDVYSAGDNTYGKLGTGAALGAVNSTFKRVLLPAGVKAVALANGDEYTAFILGDNGRVYAMGRNNNGQLGNGTTTDSATPVEVQVPRQETVY